MLNNAGYTLVGTVEEASDADIRSVFDTNFFGAVHVVQAALPYLRKQGSGHIVTVSSSLGIGPMPLIGFYCATKAAIESIHESLAPEVKGFGIKVTLIEPGAYATDFGSPTSRKMAAGMDTYADLRTRVFAGLATAERGDPQATADAVLSVVDADEPPLRFALGSTVLPMARTVYADRVATWTAWEEVSNAAQGEPRATATATAD